MNPILSLDIGTRWGANAVQIATGILAANSDNVGQPRGRVISVDKETGIYGSKQPVGKFIPESIRPHWVELVTSDAVLYLKMDSNFYELIYEDTAHSVEFTQALYEVAIDRLVEGGVIISHDACHPKFKNSVVTGISACGINPHVYLVEGDSCGLAIWQKPKSDGVGEVVKEGATINSHRWDVPDGIIDVGVEEEPPSPIHIENPPKRKRRKPTKRKPKKEKSL